MPLLPAAGPVRVMAASTLVNTFGNGLFTTAAVLFYTRSIGLSTGQVALGLAVAGGIGLAVSLPAGHLGDLRGAREVLLVALGLEALLTGSLVLVHSFGAFLVTLPLLTVADSAASSLRQGLIASALPAGERVAGRAYLRSVTNLGIAGGAALAGLGIAADSRSAYVALVLGDAATYLVAGLLLQRLPATVHVTGAPRPRMLDAARDLPFVAVTGLNGVLSVNYVLLDVAAPLWIARETSAPRWTIAVLFLVNTAVCVLLQVWASRRAVDVASSARVARLGSVLIAASCLVFALAAHHGAALAVGILLLAALVNVFGELFQAAGSWGLGFGLAPEQSQGAYQGLFATGSQASRALGPLLVTATAIDHGDAGWVVLALVFVAAGVLLPPTTRWAERERVSVLSAT